MKITAPGDGEPRDGHDYPPLAYAAWVVFVLLIVTLSSLLDRQLPSLAVKPLKAAFQISDTAFSLIQGSAFAFFYTVMGVPFGRLVDRKNRRNLIIVGLIVWSVMTLATGFAQSYWQLLLLRVGVGIGEACLAPAAYSIITDYFPTRLRARALSAYYLSLALGAGASLAIGGWILNVLPPSGMVLPWVGVTAPWRLLFIAVGLPGLLIAPLMISVREPRRREAGGTIAVESAILTDFLGYVREHRRTFAFIVASASGIGLIGYANIGWAVALFDRKFGISAAQAGPTLGFVLSISGLGGTLISGILSDHWAKAGRADARFRVLLLAWIGLVPTGIAWPLVHQPQCAYVLLAANLFFCVMGQSAGPVMIQEVVPNRMRGQATAAFMLVVGIISLALGPTAPALLTDHLFHNEASLDKALAVVAICGALVGPLAAWIGLRHYAVTWSAANARRGA